METRGVRLEDAFRQAWCDQTTRNRYFLTPLALEQFKRPEPTGSDDHNRPSQLSKKQRKAEKKKEQAQMQKKGDGKGKVKEKLLGCAPYTADGQKVCLDFNTKDMVCRRGRVCTFAHVCGRCFKVGTPMYSCDHKGASKARLAEERETPTSAEAQKESQQEELGRQQSEVTEEKGFDCSHVVDKLRCLSGKRRVGDLRECLAASLKSSKATLVMREIDAVRGKKNQNLLSAKLQNALMAEVVAEKFDLVVASPPCSTFSRARSASVSGPPPLQSRLHPRGFPWLSKLARAQVASSNRLVDFTIKLLEAQVANGPKHMVVLEHPEDLGRRQNGAAPASIWQWPVWRQKKGRLLRSSVPMRLRCSVFEADEPTDERALGEKFAGRGPSTDGRAGQLLKGRFRKEIGRGQR